MHHGNLGSLVLVAVLVAIILYAGRGSSIHYRTADVEGEDDAE
jgi:hypothetical protein